MVLKKEIALQIKNLLKENPQGLKITDIIKKVKINRNTAGRYLENMLVSGQVEMRRFGMAKIYSLSQRVPLSALLSISSELILQLDTSLRVIYANEPFLLLVGTDSKSLLGKNIEYSPVATMFDDRLPQFIEKIKEGIAGKQWADDIILPTKDFILFCRIAPTVFEDGRKGVSIIFEDITEKKLAEKALQNSEMQYRSLVETTGTGYVIIDKDGRVVTANQEYVRLTGRSTLSEIEGRAVTDWTAPYDLERNAREIEKCFRRGQVRDLEIDYQRPDRTIQPIEVNASVIQSDSGKIILALCRDITQRKKEQELLRESEDKYRKLVEISPEAVIIHQGGKISFVNSAAIKLLGASHSNEILGKNILTIIHPDFHDSVMKNIEKDLRGEMSPSTELYILRLDGTSVIVEGRGVKTVLGGKPALQVALRDISERKRSEEALRENEGKLNAMLQSIPDIMSMMDEELTIMWANEPAKRCFGNDIIGKKCYEMYHLIQDPCEPYPCLTLKAFLDGKTHQHETTVIDIQGTERFFECTATVALRDNSGKPVAVLEISRDVTDKKKALNTLRESEERYRTLAEASKDLIFLIGKDDRVEYVNSYASGMVNKPVNQIIGQLRSSLFSPDVARNQKKGLDVVFETGDPVHNEGILEFNGQKYWFDHLLTPLKDTDFHVRSVLGISRDITQRKRAEDALLDSEERYRSFVNRATDVICVIQDGIIKMCNPRLPELWGGSMEEIIGKPISEFIHPDALTEVVDRYNRRMAGESPSSIYETVFMRKDGSKSYVELNAGIITYEGKNADLVIVRDINERKNATQALFESEEKYRSLVTTTGDIIWETDDQAHFVFVSPQVESIIGFKPDELIGHTPFEFLKPDAIGPNQKMFGMAIENKEKSVIYISHWLHKNGHSVYLESHAVPVYRSDGSFSGFIGIDRKKTL